MRDKEGISVKNVSIAFSGFTEASSDHLKKKPQNPPQNQTQQNKQTKTQVQQTQTQKNLQTLKPPNHLKTMSS